MEKGKEKILISIQYKVAEKQKIVQYIGAFHQTNIELQLFSRTNNRNSETYKCLQVQQQF